MAEKQKVTAKKPASQAPADERLLTIPLRREWLKAPMNRRARRSITTIRGHLSRHMKVPGSDIRISAKLNDAVWTRGAGKPPARIRLKASLDASTGLLHARLPDEEAPKSKDKKPPKEEKPAKAGEPEKEAEKKEEAKPKEEKAVEAEPVPQEKPSGKAAETKESDEADSEKTAEKTKPASEGKK